MSCRGRWRSHHNSGKSSQPIRPRRKLDVQTAKPIRACSVVLGFPLLVALEGHDPQPLVTRRNSRAKIATRFASHWRVAPSRSKNTATSDNATSACQAFAGTLLLDHGDPATELGQEQRVPLDVLRQLQNEL